MPNDETARAPSNAASPRWVGSSDAEHGHVYLVGAGPGAPDLLTLRAARLLATADVVLPDDLVSEAIVALANPRALVTPVGKRCGQPRITQAGIHELMIAHAEAGRSVVRLKSGDPLVFGRANEEIAALRAAAIPFAIVPGISAAFGAAAVLRTSLTDRSSASKLILATAHHAAGKLSGMTWEGALPADATLAIYMPGRDFAGLSTSLLAAGVPSTTPVVAISRVSTPAQETQQTTVGALAALQPGLAPMLLLIGEALRYPLIAPR